MKVSTNEINDKAVTYEKLDDNLRKVIDRSYPIVDATGTTNYVASNPQIKVLDRTTRFTLYVQHDGSGNCSLNLNNWGVKPIRDSYGNVVTNMKANVPFNVCFNGTDFTLQGKGGGGNAEDPDVLYGKTFSNNKGPRTGTMVNNGALRAKIEAGKRYPIPKGYHDGNGYIEAMTISEQTGLPNGSFITVSMYAGDVVGFHNDVLCWHGDHKLYAKNVKTNQILGSADIKGGNYVSYGNYHLSSDGKYMYYSEFRAGRHADKPTHYKVALDGSNSETAICSGDIAHDCGTMDGYMWRTSYRHKALYVSDKNGHQIYSRGFGGNHTDNRPNATSMYLKNGRFSYVFDGTFYIIEPGKYYIEKHAKDFHDLTDGKVSGNPRVSYIDDDKQHVLLSWGNYTARVPSDFSKVDWIARMSTGSAYIVERNNRYIIGGSTIDKNTGEVLYSNFFYGASINSVFKDGNDYYMILYYNRNRSLHKIIFTD